MITAAQMRLLRAAIAALELDDDSYRSILRAEAGVSSSKDLDNKSLNLVLASLEKLGFRNTSSKRRDPRPAGTVTPEQQTLIAQNYARLEELSAAAGDPGFTTMQARMGFNRRQCGKAFPQTIADAIKVIEGQKAFIARLEKKAVTGNVAP